LKQTIQEQRLLALIRSSSDPAAARQIAAAILAAAVPHKKLPLRDMRNGSRNEAY